VIISGYPGKYEFMHPDAGYPPEFALIKTGEYELNFKFFPGVFNV
jgi:hypothetical protein